MKTPPLASHVAPEDNLTASLYRISTLVSETDDVHTALEAVLDELILQLPANSTSISLIDPDTKQLDIEVSRGLPADAKAFRLPVGRGITGQVAVTGRARIVRDVRAEPNYIALRGDVRSEIAVPMMLLRQGPDGTMKESVVGVINADSTEIAAFNEEHLRRLTALTQETTRVVSRLWSIGKLVNKTRQLETILNAGARLVRQHGIERVLSSIALDAVQLVDCHFCAIFLLNEDRSLLELECTSGAIEVPLEDRSFRPADSAIWSTWQLPRGLSPCW